MAFLIPIVAIIGAFGSTAYIAYVIMEILRGRQRASVSREFNSKLLDRVSSVQDLGSLMNTEGGARLLASVAGTETPSSHGRILHALQSGLVLLALGIGLFGYAFMSPTLPVEGFEIVTMLGTISTALGVGLLLAAVAALAMARRLGLLNGDAHPRATDPVHTA